MGRLFGTDGVRGIANLELTPELAFKLGRASAYLVMKQKGSKPVFLIGTDTRISRDMLSSSLASGICSVGGDVIHLGIVPTPAVAYLAKQCDVDAGVVISASHNSYEYNGIKFFSHEGLKFSDEIENHIESIILAERDEICSSTHLDIGVIRTDNELINLYIRHLRDSIDTDLTGMKVLLDCANGAAYKIAPDVLRRLGADVTVINDTPDGVNINKDCGSTHIQELREKTLPEGIDCAMAFDGDADRILMIDDNKDIVDGDKLLTIIGLYYLSEAKLKKNAVVATVMSNMGLDIMAQKNGINIIKTKVGDRYVLEEMLKHGYSLGGEQSGHIIILDKNTTGDGILTGLTVLEIMKKRRVKLSLLGKSIEILPQVLYNAKVNNIKKEFFDKDELITEQCVKLEKLLGGQGRVLVRPSGTEPLIRIMIEGRDLSFINEQAKLLGRLIEKRMN